MDNSQRPQDAVGPASPAAEDLLESLCLGDMSPEKWERLASEVAGDAEARRRYVETMHLMASLPYLLGGPTADEHGPAGHASVAGVASDVVASEIKAAHDTKNARRFSRGEPRGRRWFPFWAQAACVAFAVGGLGAWQLARRFDVRPLVASGPAVKLAGAPSNIRAGDDHVGRVAALSPAASAHGLLQTLQVGQQLRRGEVIQLTAGAIQVEQNSGYRVLVEGPAEFSLMGDDCVFVRNGRVAARGQGEFTVQTPLLTAICRTADAVFDVSDDDEAQASVDRGEAAVALTPQEGIAGKQISVLKSQEGIACTADPATGERHFRPAPPIAHVVRDWNEVERNYDAYERMVLASEPTAYWPLRQVRRNRRVLDLTQHGFDGMPVGNWPLEETAAASDEGVYFNGESYIEPDRKPPIDPAQGFTIESWAKVAGGPEFQSIFTSRWVLNSMKPDCQCFGFTLYAGDSDCWEFWTGSGVKGEIWQRLVSGVAVDRNNWNHVVATFEPREIRSAEQVVLGHVTLILNGKVIAEGDHQLATEDFEWPARIGAAEFVPRYLTSWMFQGRLSDVALYNRPLKVEVVKRHFESGQGRRLNKVTQLPELPTQRTESFHRRGNS